MGAIRDCIDGIHDVVESFRDYIDEISNYIDGINHFMDEDRFNLEAFGYIRESERNVIEALDDQRGDESHVRGNHCYQ